MPLDAGSKLGPYEVVAPLGAGGMGEVYRARDTRLDREVAIKVLPEQMSRNHEFRQRFQREAQVISDLTHPNICTLHDIGEHNGGDYLVMELIEGDTLAQRISKGPLQVEQVVRIGIDVAAALDSAHRAGIVHRDLKPGNIILSKTGAKLLDFGLAKSAFDGSSMTTAPGADTLTEPLTTKGTLLGTFQYMAPEQLEGQDADARTDIFAFGAMLHEMATGQRAFSGSTRASLITAIMSTEPAPISHIQPMSPPALDHVVRMCLAKDPDDRIQTAHDVKLQLQWISEGGSQVGSPAIVSRRLRGRERLAWVTASLACIVALAAVYGALVRRTPPAVVPIVQAEFSPPEDAVYTYRSGPPALSPDGRMLAFLALRDETRSLWIRDLPRATVRHIPGTAGAAYPFWSPDGQSIGFFDGSYLKRVDVRGASPDIICAADGARGGGTWNREGIILFTGGPLGNDGLFSVPASGGQPSQVTEIDRSVNEFAHRAPWFLPDGRRFLFSTRRGIGGKNGVSIGNLDGTAPRRVLEVDSNAVFIEPEHVLYWRDGAVRLQRFDVDSETVIGDSVVVARQVRFEPTDTMALFSVSQNGTLAFHPGHSATAKSQLILKDRSGQTVGTVGQPGNYYTPRFSHDGTLVAVDSSGVQNNGDIWVFGVDTPTAMRVTSDPADESRPIWSPEDDRIIYLSGKGGPDSMFAKDLSHLAVEQPVLINDAYTTPTDCSPDGLLLAFNNAVTEGQDGNIWLLSLDDGTARPFVESPFTVVNLDFAPDGHWVAYESNETGQREVFVQSFPEATHRRQISVAGGFGPKWRSGGKELFYRAPDGHIMVVAFEDNTYRASAPPVALFKTDSRFPDDGEDFDVTADGQTILINIAIEDHERTPMSVLVNWSESIND